MLTERFAQLPLRYRLALAQGTVTLASLLLGAGGVFLLGGALTDTGFILFLVLAEVCSLSLSLIITLPLARRLQWASEISRGWLRGNLHLRIADRSTDEIGSLTERLDLLAQHLDQDERDLTELREYNTRLADQVRELAVVEERNRLARDLHDGVKQYLFSLAITTSAVRSRLEGLSQGENRLLLPSDLFEMINEVENSAKAAQREMARLIEDLRPVSLQELGLAGALNSFTLLFGAREHLLIYFDKQGTDTHLPLAIADALYRIAQEALLNVARHAMATRVDITLTCLPEQAILVIHDNGSGFDTSRPSKGLGMESMHERILAIGGKLTITSQTGNGTTLIAEVALSRPISLSVPHNGESHSIARTSIENWVWLGQRLMIPVGQVWPWLPADQAHLRQPLVEADAQPLTLLEKVGPFHLFHGYILYAGSHPFVRLSHSQEAYAWHQSGAHWRIEMVPTHSGQGHMVLTRNGQPLAAMQYQGRLLNVWTEIIFDGHGYTLSYTDDWRYTLTDEAGEELLLPVNGPPLQLQVKRTLPLALLLMVTVRMIEEKNL